MSKHVCMGTMGYELSVSDNDIKGHLMFSITSGDKKRWISVRVSKRDARIFMHKIGELVGDHE